MPNEMGSHKSEQDSGTATQLTTDAVVTTADGILLPWVEKYRPTSLGDVVSHHDIVHTIQQFISNEQLPHLLFHGPPGTGKTSTVFAIAKTLYKDAMAQMVLELNASDDRGINVVRENIRTFAKTSAVTWGTGAPSAAASGTSSTIPPVANSNANSTTASSSLPLQRIKLVILDEADQMTRDAQNALRRIMEKYAQHVRFCVICNLINKINPAIQSRCTKFRFPPLPEADLKQRTLQIASAENVGLTADGLSALVANGQGDMRKVLNSLQSAALAHPEAELSGDIVLSVLGLPVASDVDVIFKSLASDGFETAANVIRSLQIRKGYALSDIVNALYRKSLTVTWPRPVSVVLFPRLADIEHRLSHGCDESIEVSALVSAFFETRFDLQKIRDGTAA